jgi:DNA-directed RNA polymerase subunit RPC12/RpoP
METRYLCPDCGHEHDEPGVATLGLRIRCLDCQIEVDLAFELTTISIPLIAA